MMMVTVSQRVLQGSISVEEVAHLQREHRHIEGLALR
uniref:Uncharacterized protein n=1 Tax=Arundo donax TaxID=35708 RepID=A0A0A9HH32_ARUDO